MKKIIKQKSYKKLKFFLVSAGVIFVLLGGVLIAGGVYAVGYVTSLAQKSHPELVTDAKEEVSRLRSVSLGPNCFKNLSSLVSVETLVGGLNEESLQTLIKSCVQFSSDTELKVEKKEIESI